MGQHQGAESCQALPSSRIVAAQGGSSCSLPVVPQNMQCHPVPRCSERACKGFLEHCTCCFCSSRAPTCVSYCFVLTQNWREQLQIPKTNEQRETPDQRHVFTCPMEWPGCWEAETPRAQELCLGRGAGCSRAPLDTLPLPVLMLAVQQCPTVTGAGTSPCPPGQRGSGSWCWDCCWCNPHQDPVRQPGKAG